MIPLCNLNFRMILVARWRRTHMPFKVTWDLMVSIYQLTAQPPRSVHELVINLTNLKLYYLSPWLLLFSEKINWMKIQLLWSLVNPSPGSSSRDASVNFFYFSSFSVLSFFVQIPLTANDNKSKTFKKAYICHPRHFF